VTLVIQAGKVNIRARTVCHALVTLSSKLCQMLWFRSDTRRHAKAGDSRLWGSWWFNAGTTRRSRQSPLHRREST